MTITSIYQWQNNRPALESNGEKILETLKKGTAIAADPGETPPLAPDVAKRCFHQLANSYEEEYGGFREAPKFPSPGRFSVKSCTSLRASELLSHLCFCLSFSPLASEPDVPHVVLVCEPLHLRRCWGSSNGPAHAAHDGTGRHPWPCGTGLNWLSVKIPDFLNYFLLYNVEQKHTLLLIGAAIKLALCSFYFFM